MNTHPNIEERLWDYIDGLSSPQEKSAIEQLIETNIEWRSKHTELLTVQQMMSESVELDAPSMRFTQNVMEQIAQFHIAPATKSYINNKIIYGIGGFFITLILGFLIYAFAQLSPTAVSGTTPLVDMSKIDYSKIFNNNFVNGFMMLNVVLGLALLDMYLNNRKKQFQKQ
jgi:hypothetical protein